ncbi:MAG: alpha/beta hydrolase [Rhodobacteraceae bacterium]|nr:alpha/beta hydrolase [Paracoccaceae bacterium]
MKRAIAIIAILVVAGAAIYTVMARSGQFQLTRAELRERYTDPTSRFVTVKGMEIHYKDEGAGEPVLLLHGSFGTVKTWDGVVDKLKAEYRLIRFDQPPTGLSGEFPPGIDGLSLEDFVAAFLDEIGVDRLSLAGTSSGGIIAYRFASKYPERTNALVLSNVPSAVVDNSATDTPPLLGALISISSWLRYQPKVYWRSFLESLYADPGRLKESTVQAYYDFGRRRREAPFVRSMMARVNANAEIDEVLRKVTAPTLLLWGVPDRVLPLALGEQLKAKLSATDAQLIVLENTGHYPPVESPDTVADHIGVFLGRTLGAGGLSAPAP